MENIEEFQGKIMMQKWDLHRQIKESLAVLDPQSSKRSLYSSENEQNFANVDNYEGSELESPTAT